MGTFEKVALGLGVAAVVYIATRPKAAGATNNSQLAGNGGRQPAQPGAGPTPNAQNNAQQRNNIQQGFDYAQQGVNLIPGVVSGAQSLFNLFKSDNPTSVPGSIANSDSPVGGVDPADSYVDQGPSQNFDVDTDAGVVVDNEDVNIDFSGE